MGSNICIDELNEIEKNLSGKAIKKTLLILSFVISSLYLGYQIL